VVLGAPPKGAILSINDYGTPFWSFGNNDGDLLVYREAGLTGWQSFTSPPSSGTYVLGSRDGQMAWLQTEDCDEEN
jgi:hypothetical protein